MTTAIWLSPKQNRLVIRRNKLHTKKPGQMVELAQTRNKSQEGVVVAIGPKVSDIKVGELVLFMEWSGQETPGTRGDEYITMSEDEVLCGVDQVLLDQMEAELAEEKARWEKTKAEEQARLNAETEARLAAAMPNTIRALQSAEAEIPPLVLAGENPGERGHSGFIPNLLEGGGEAATLVEVNPGHGDGTVKVSTQL